MEKIKIANKFIGEGEPIFIIGEAGSNHNGKINLAKELIDIAVKSGVDAVKFQTFKAEKLVTKTAPKAEYQKKGIDDKEPYFKLLKNLELSKDEHKKLKRYCDKKGIIFMSTPHSGKWSVDLLEDLNVPAYKIGSGDLTNLPFLEYIASKNKPIILSAGMATLEEIQEAVNVIKKAGNNKIIVLQCTSSYPCPIEDANLRVMQTIKEKCNVLVGYSDHTLGIEVPVAAAALGAVIIEKHFTIDRNLSGPDHKASLEPDELKDMVEKIRNVEKALGTPIKKVNLSEVEIAKVARKSIIAAKNIPKGTKITMNMLEIKRPGTGILPKFINKVVGRISKIDIKKDSIIKFSDLK